MSIVFISYSHVDAKVADDLCQILNELKIKNFRDVKQIDWGGIIEDEVRKALTTCRAILVIVSPSSLKSPWVHYEIGHATAQRRKVLPFLTDPSIETPLYIKSLNYVTTLEEVHSYFVDTFPNEKLPIDVASERLVLLLHYLDSKKNKGYISKEMITQVLRDYECGECYAFSDEIAWHTAADYALKYLESQRLISYNERQVKISPEGIAYVNSKEVRADYPCIFDGRNYDRKHKRNRKSIPLLFPERTNLWSRFIKFISNRFY